MNVAPRDALGLNLLDALYDKHAPKIYGFLLTKTLEVSTAEELLVLVFKDVWKEIELIGMNEEKKILSIVLRVLRRYNEKNKQ